MAASRACGPTNASASARQAGIRLLLHYSGPPRWRRVPDAGRAGRDGDAARCCHAVFLRGQGELQFFMEGATWEEDEGHHAGAQDQPEGGEWTLPLCRRVGGRKSRVAVPGVRARKR